MRLARQWPWPTPCRNARRFLHPCSAEWLQTGDCALAEQQSSYEFVEVKSSDILAERQAGWAGFTTFATWGIGLTVLTLVLMAIFVV